MTVIDFHSHILPGIDDGSDSAVKSLQMYELSKTQGVDLIAATPHFYATRTGVEEFLQRRAEAYQHMQVKLLLGAEVAYFPKISEAKKISLLTVEGTNLLLLELPFTRWEETIYREVRSLIEERGMQIMLVHPERYLSIGENKKWMYRFLELPLWLQINAGSLTDWRLRRKAIKLLRDTEYAVLGSDMHGMHRRPPNLFEGRRILERALGREYIQKMDIAGEKLLKG